MIFLPVVREAALQRWREFLPTVEQYGRRRNDVTPALENVSRLSVALRFRSLLEDEVLADSLAQGSIPSLEKWLQEVCWRRYWKGWLEMRPAVWRDYRAALRMPVAAEVSARAQALMDGRSGVACMDRLARQLVETGYLHNHARMWWASFWIHGEGLPWELGADFFFRHLLDADPASNTLSWRWVAGLQTAGKTYLVRLSNIEKYAPFLLDDPTGSERLADGVVQAWCPAEMPLPPSPQPMVQWPCAVAPSLGRWGVWLHPDDVSPVVGPLAALAPVAVVAVASAVTYGGCYRLSPQREATIRLALADGLERARAHWGCATELLEADRFAECVAEWAVRHELVEVVALAPFVGPVADVWPRVQEQLAARGIRLTGVRRAADAHAFQLARAGFFPFWEKMKRHLAGEG